MDDLHITNGSPKILLFDIETAPALAWVWAQFDTSVIATEQDWYMLCFAYKWLDEKRTYFVSQEDDPKHKPDSPKDKWVAERLHRLFDEADIVIAHNGKKFDERKANARFMYWGLGPASPVMMIDTVVHARRYFANYSNSLNELGRLYLEIEKEPHEGFQLWRDVMSNIPGAWAKMQRYNRKDIVLLEKIYLLIRPWIKGHPNMNHFIDGIVCPNCGSEDKAVVRKYYYTGAYRYPQYQCGNCSKYWKSPVSEGARTEARS